MKKKEIRDIFNLPILELHKQADNLLKELRKLEIERTTGKLKNSNLLGLIKKDIARLKTVIRIKELAKK